MPFDVESMVEYAVENKKPGLPHSPYECAKYVRLAIMEEDGGGLALESWPISAKDYGPKLLAAGFIAVYKFFHLKDVETKGPVAAPKSNATMDILGEVFQCGFNAFSTRFYEQKGCVRIPLKAEDQKTNNPYSPKIGDIVVIQPYSVGSKHGHIAIYTGQSDCLWVSDFKQNDMWGGEGYRSFKPDATVFRYP